MSKRTTPLEQPSLFASYEVSGTGEGATEPVLDREQQLLEILDLKSQQSQLGGLEARHRAIERGSSGAKEVEAKQAADRAKYRAAELGNEAESKFYKMWGLEALIASGATDETEARAMARADLGAFLLKYAGPDQATKNRKATKSQIERNNKFRTKVQSKQN